jgi:catechol 2,3-dioxygenase-like lactoylglutathione lyase family enzyme
MVLSDRELLAFVATSRADAALRFYRDVLGLKLISEDAFAIVLRTANAMLRIQKVDGHRPPPYTALGWCVPNIGAAARELSERGVHFERYSGLEQDSAAIWTSPSGARVAWFKDPDGNVLSITQLGGPATD